MYWYNKQDVNYSISIIIGDCKGIHSNKIYYNKANLIPDCKKIKICRVYTRRFWDCKSQSRACKLKQITVDNKKYSDT